MNIVMLGFRGTGKSVISKILARRLKRKRVCLDELIARSAGVPIPEIIEKSGWSGFRAMESHMVEEISKHEQDAVIDCGGGVVLDDQNIRRLKEQGRAVLLRADLKALLRRIRNDSNRPRLKEGMSFEEELKIVCAEREPKYLAAADMICDTTRKKPKDTASDIIDFFKEKSWI